MSNSEVLVLTHPYPFFNDDSEVAERIDEVVKDDEIDTVGVGTSRGKRDKGQPYGGRENYQEWFEDLEGYGRISEQAAQDLKSQYDTVYQGGFDRHQCVGRTRESLNQQGIDTQIMGEYTNDSEIFNMF